MIVLSVFAVTARQNALQQYAAIQTVKTLFISEDNAVLYAPWRTLPLQDIRMQVMQGTPKNSRRIFFESTFITVPIFLTWINYNILLKLV